MRLAHLNYLVCPRTRRPLAVRSVERQDDQRIWEGELHEPVSGHAYPIRRGIPRFVGSDNYAANFGFQWNLHKLTQNDAHSRLDLSRRRFQEETRWAADLAGQVILEAGSGAGRFTPHALATGAMVVSFDYSLAVEANFELHGSHPNLLLVQASLYEMPFPEGFFPRVFCFGVIQHTPDPAASFRALARMLAPGGSLATDVYFRSFRLLFHIKTWLRPFTKRCRPEPLYRFTRAYVNALWPLARMVRRRPAARALVARLVADRTDWLGEDADDRQLKEWALLDTYDWFSPAHDHPQTLATVRRWHEQAGLADIEVHRGYNGVEARGRRPP